MTDDLNADQQIRQAAVIAAVNLEFRLPAILGGTEGLSPGREVTEQDAAVLNGRARQIEVETADRVLRDARLFTEFIRSGLDADAAVRAWPFPVFGEGEQGQP
jgi:hypothetical protein